MRTLTDLQSEALDEIVHVLEPRKLQALAREALEARIAQVRNEHENYSFNRALGVAVEQVRPLGD